ncbi:mechanosensory protein 2 [Echinococcus multilocularis]|uniref:Mechanosensory protein 2 n=1 Tax=Echinococcus multilocularis TaxID=6211 RepID=A0A068Y711_ECHMU|nr:mechanosensory protein 2 [Echinococcus multilocularis]
MTSTTPSVLVPAPNLGTAEPPLAIIYNLRSGNISVNPLPANSDLAPQNLSEYRLTVPVTTVRRKSVTLSEDDMWRGWSTKTGQNHRGEERESTATASWRGGGGGGRTIQRQGFGTEAWRIQNRTLVEQVLEMEEKLQSASPHSQPSLTAAAKIPYSPPRIVKPKKASQSAKKRAFAPKAFTLGGRRIEPVHSDEEWFLERLLRIFALIAFVLTLPFSLLFCFKVVAHYERAVVFRLGRLFASEAQGPGLIFLLPCLDNCRVVDLRTFTFNVPTQEVLTKDSLTVAVNAVVYYRIRNPVCAVVNVEDANRSTRLLGQTTLRNVLGTVNLDELLTAREDIAILMQECLDSVTEAWGVKVERVEIKDVRLPIQLQRAMAAEAEAAREATAKVIAAEGEMRASSALKFAALEISQHPIAMQLRYLQTLNTISLGKKSTIVFPIPIDMLKFFMGDEVNIPEHLLEALIPTVQASQPRDDDLSSVSNEHV